MGRSPCCAKEGINKGAWTALEDKILTSYIKVHGEGQWRNLPKRAGLKRCGKSCRLRWLNYLRPDIKRGNISHDEEELIIRLHKLLGNRWSLIAGRLPGRTDNEIKNYWNTTLGKKAKGQLFPPPSQESSQTKSRRKKQACEPNSTEEPSNSPLTATTKVQVIRTKASKCSKALVPLLTHPPQTTDQVDTTKSTTVDTLQQLQDHQSNLTDNPSNLKVFEHGDEAFQEMHDTNDSSGLLNFGCNNEAKVEVPSSTNYVPVGAEQCLPFVEPTNESWTTNCLEDNAMMNLESLAFLLDPDEWP